MSGLFRKVDCIRIPVPDLELGLLFYRDALGHDLLWRSATAAGLKMPGSDSELVVHTEGDAGPNLLVDDLWQAVDRVVDAGGRVLEPPRDIQIGRCAVLADPWGNALVLLDMSKGALIIDAAGNVIGNAEPRP